MTTANQAALPLESNMKATNGFCPSGTPAEASPDNYLPLNLHYPGLKKVHASPPIYVCDNFLTEEECESFIRVAGPLLQRSKTHAIAGTAHPPKKRRDGYAGTSSPHLHCAARECICCAGSEATKGRTSLTCHLAKKTFPCPILLQKIQALTNKPFGHMELPQVARYTDSQRYVEHYDGVDPNTDAGRAFCANGGQRVAVCVQGPAMHITDHAHGGLVRVSADCRAFAPSTW
jgi:prolyl 4-hydroxylase